MDSCGEHTAESGRGNHPLPLLVFKITQHHVSSMFFVTVAEDLLNG